MKVRYTADPARLALFAWIALARLHTHSLTQTYIHTHSLSLSLPPPPTPRTLRQCTECTPIQFLPFCKFNVYPPRAPLMRHQSVRSSGYGRLPARRRTVEPKPKPKRSKKKTSKPVWNDSQTDLTAKYKLTSAEEVHRPPPPPPNRPARLPLFVALSTRLAVGDTIAQLAGVAPWGGRIPGQVLLGNGRWSWVYV